MKDSVIFDCHKDSIPEHLILDLIEAVRPLFDYLDKGFGKRYMEINCLIDGILDCVCNDAPEHSLTDYIALLEIEMAGSDFEVGEVIDLMYDVELLGMLLIKKFQDLGYYNLRGFWGYRIEKWLTPTSLMLGYHLNFEIDDLPERLVSDSLG